MLDTLSIVRDLMDADIEQRSAEAIAEAIRNGQAETVSKDFVRAEMGEFRAEVRGDIGKLRAEMGEFRGEVRAEIAEFRGEVRTEMANLQVNLTERINALQRWMIGMLFGLLASILTQILLLVL